MIICFFIIQSTKVSKLGQDGLTISLITVEIENSAVKPQRFFPAKNKIYVP